MVAKPKTDIASIARSLIETAAKSLATGDGYPPTATVLRQYRLDARSVATAIIRDLAGGPRGEATVTTEHAGAVRLNDLAEMIEQVSLTAAGGYA